MHTFAYPSLQVLNQATNFDKNWYKQYVLKEMQMLYFIISFKQQ